MNFKNLKQTNLNKSVALYSYEYEDYYSFTQINRFIIIRVGMLYIMPSQIIYNKLHSVLKYPYMKSIQPA